MDCNNVGADLGNAKTVTDNRWKQYIKGHVKKYFQEKILNTNKPKTDKIKKVQLP